MLKLFLLGTVPSVAWPFSIDGIIGPGDNYTSVFTLSYQMADLSYLHGGTLALGSDANGQYMYFAAPKGFVDNSYGVNAIGWGGVNNGHTFDHLLKSDHAQFMFYTGPNGQSPAHAYIDYLATNQAGAYGSCGVTTPASSTYPQQCDSAGSDALSQQIIVDVVSSLEYNLNHFSSVDLVNNTTGAPGADGLPDVDVLVDSPYADTNYQNVQAGYEGWQYELAYEIHFQANTFDSAIWNSNDPLLLATVIEFLDPHASPNKLNSATPPTVCIDGCGPTPIPAPGPLALTLLGLFGLRHHIRRRLN